MGTATTNTKPLGRKAYGSIGHLPGSRVGPGDHRVNDGQYRICCKRARDKHDFIVVQEKLDGSNVAVAKIGGEIVPLNRAGYRASSSPYEQHRHFHAWVIAHADRFDDLLDEGERACGEWLMQAHGTRYDLGRRDPFALFDIMEEDRRQPIGLVAARAAMAGITIPKMIYCGTSIAIDAIREAMEPSGHGAIDPVEGAVWRVERNGRSDFLAKYVRPDKVDGCYLLNPDGTQREPVWNLTPARLYASIGGTP